MDKNRLMIGFLLVMILAAPLSYWLGYRDGSSRRFVADAKNHALAFDGRTGQLCRAVPPPPPLEKQLSVAGCPSNPLDVAFSNNEFCKTILNNYAPPNPADTIPQCKNLK